jgi:hypothetical protein
MKTGNTYNTTIDDILDRVTDGTIVQCTFDNREKVVSLLRELKEKKPGISVIVSGVTDIVQGIMDETDDRVDARFRGAEAHDYVWPCHGSQ